MLRFVPRVPRVYPVARGLLLPSVSARSLSTPPPPGKPGDPVTPVEKPPLSSRIWRRVKEEAHHYWVGTKLLGSNMRVSSKLLMRVARGEILSRREKLMLEMTVADTIRLMPFLVIAVVPFLEFSLPFLLRLFPNMLPSTYTTREQESVKTNASLKIRLEMAKFLQAATSRMVADDEVTEETARAFLDRAAKGLPVSNKEIIRIGKVLKSEFALSNIGLEQLQAVARFFGVSPYGPKSYVIYQLERKLKKFRQDDALIAQEGLEKLTLPELTEANFRRGMPVEGRTREQLEQQLEDWMELADSEDIPPFLLLLSRSFDTHSNTKITQEAFGKLAASERLEALLEELPDRGVMYERKLNAVAATGDEPRSDLSSTFALVDSDRDGTIDAVELKILMQRLGESYPQQKIEALLKSADANQDGEIDFKEFVAVMRKALEDSDESVSGIEKEMLRIRADILRTRKENARTTVTPVPDVAAKMRTTVATIIDEVEKELSQSTGGTPQPPATAGKAAAEAAGAAEEAEEDKPHATSAAPLAPKVAAAASAATADKARRRVWENSELWTDSPTTKAKQ